MDIFEKMQLARKFSGLTQHYRKRPQFEDFNRISLEFVFDN